MRKVFPKVVEEGRRRVGPYLSRPGDRFGAFYLKRPGGSRLKVIASDGADWKEAELPGEPWEHVSVSRENSTPIWEDMVWVKSLFWEAEEWVVQYHPKESQYVNTHPNVLHLWKPAAGDFPVPPVDCV